MNTQNQYNDRMDCFSVALMRELMSNVYNCYGGDNWDYERFSKKVGFLTSILSHVNSVFQKVGISLVVSKNINLKFERITRDDVLQGLLFLYDQLADGFSKDMLVKVIAYRILGGRKIKLPLNTSTYWETRKKAEDLIKGNETISLNFNNWSLKYFELDDIGFPLKLFNVPIGVATTFLLRQYSYKKIFPCAIEVQEGDYVIDAGGCWGDTALFFAYETGPSGKVYSFEFIPGNLDIMTQNLRLNPDLSNVEIIRNPLWEKSGIPLFYVDNGPGSRVSQERISESDIHISTLSIDDFTKNHNIPKVDFIKMDIEGAELSALKGAVETIRQHKPKLAISLYHSLNDFVDIPEYLSSIGVKYKYYLDHFTIHAEETVLFAIPE